MMPGGGPQGHTQPRGPCKSLVEWENEAIPHTPPYPTSRTVILVAIHPSPTSKTHMLTMATSPRKPHPLSRQYSVNTSSSSGAARLSPDDRDANRDTKKAERRTERRERRQITQGQTKDAASKKGSRHADVIDTWDPTGLGSASE